VGQRGRLLLGAFETADQAVAYVRRVSVPDGRDIGRLWSDAREAFLATAPDTVRAQEHAFPADELAEAERRIQVPLHARSLADRSWRLAHIDPRRIVTTQPYVNLDRVDVLREQLQIDPVATAFPIQTTIEVEPVITDGPTVTFKTQRRELVVSQAVAHRYETGEIDVLVRFEARPNYVIVEATAGRKILRNGNHRCVAAAYAGLPTIGSVVVALNTAPPAEVRWNKFPAAAAFGRRPPMIMDYLLPAPACIDVCLHERAYETRLTVNQSSRYSNADDATVSRTA
jgi:hypothetical protein